MGWIGQLWDYNSGDGYMHRIAPVLGISNLLRLRKDSFTFSSNKNYIYKTKIFGLDALLDTDNLKTKSPWVDSSTASFNGSNTFTPLTGDGYIYHESYPDSDYITEDWVTYTANSGLTTRGIMNTEVYETDWRINGLSWINDTCDVSIINSRTNSENIDSVCSGWNYNTVDESYFYYDVEQPSPSSPTIPSFYPNGGELNIKDEKYRTINYLYKYIASSQFNLYFDYEKSTNSESDDNIGMKLYLSNESPYNGTDTSLFDEYLSNCTPLGPQYLTTTGTSTHLGLSGYKYAIFVADKAVTSDTNNLISISNIKIEGNYYEVNNEVLEFGGTLFPLGFTPAVPLIGATFSQLTGDSTISYLLESKIGNGEFQAGKWENGVWNSGWREDINVFEFYDIDLSIKILSDIKWLVRMIGPSASINNFEIGDEVSVGNMIGIDINEKRKLLKDSYIIVGKSIHEDGRTGNILIELETTFPLRRVERDSKNHKMYVSKNIWLSGVFLNGYFSGIWNNGLFKGYPQITEMYDSQWIDGTFDGGHLNSDYYINGDFTSTFNTTNNDNKVGFTFSTPHNLAVGDLITIDKYDKSANSYYDGEHNVTTVIDDYTIETDISFGYIVPSGETGSYTTPYKDSLVQNVIFNSGNISKITSIDSLVSTEVFIYNSWLDVKYDDESAVNIGKNQTKLNITSKKYYSDNNLYGYPTNDILSSVSYFRDSHTINENSYRLGVKYKTFNDYMGESSVFSDYFDETNIDLFLEKGWTISTSIEAGAYATYSRTDGDGTYEIEGDELNIKTNMIGTFLDVDTPSVEVFNRDDRDVPKKRYTIAEFDLVAHTATYSLYYPSNESEPVEPIINFNNINKINRLGITYSISATYLPIYENINHLETSKKRKIEYFYNKRNLSLNVKGNGIDGEYETDVVINNLKLYEVDMIPFFKYYKDNNINSSVQVPYQGIAPYINYLETDFNFVDNVNLGFDSTVIKSPPLGIYSGIGNGIIDADEDDVTIFLWESYNADSQISTL